MRKLSSQEQVLLLGVRVEGTSGVFLEPFKGVPCFSNCISNCLLGFQGFFNRIMEVLVAFRGISRAYQGVFKDVLGGFRKLFK